MLLNRCTRRSGARFGGRLAAVAAACASIPLGACERGAMNPGSGTDPSRPAQATETVRVTGSSTIAPLIAEFAAEFERRNSSIRIDVETGGSSRGVADVRRGTADIGMVSRSLHDDESDLQSHLIARDGVALIVHASNPVADLSSEQITGIFTGRIVNWREVGGSDLRISVVHKADGRSTQELFLEHFGLRPADIKPNVVIGDNQQGIKTVAGARGAIGYVSIGAAEVSMDKGLALRILPLDGVPPTTDAVRSGAFLLSRDLVLVTRGSLSSAASDFIDFVRSSEADEMIRGFSFVAAR